MKMLLILVVVCAATATGKFTAPGHKRSGSDWGYGDTNGPDTWPNTHPTCGGFKQSPVALDTSQALLDTSWEPLTFTGYNIVPPTVQVRNTGHSVEVTAVLDAYVSGGNLNAKYTFSQFHFHFGAEDDRGSEHTVDGDRFPAELHIVHYKDSYSSMDEALQHNHGVAVLSVMLELSLENNTHLNPIVDALPLITNPGLSTSITSPFHLSYILPTNTDNFFSYQGSLTTPECNEVVVWTVFKETISISTFQLEEFRKLIDEDHEPMSDNFRYLQELNGRQVYMT